MDPGTALAVVSLALDVCKDLFDYYRQVKDSEDEVTRLWKKAEGLNSTLQVITDVLKGKQCRETILRQIISACHRCKELVDRLKAKLAKIMKNMDADTLSTKISHSVTRLIYPLKRSTLCKLQELIEDIQPELAHVLTVGFQDITEQILESGFSNISNDVRVLQKDLNRFREDREHDEIIKWLTVTDPSSAQAAACNAKEPGTGQWFRERQEFSDWCESKSSLLWLHGMPGCGKTVLCSSIVEHVQGLCAVKANRLCAYYYFSFSDSEAQNLQNCIASVISQFCSTRPAPRCLRDLYAAKKGGRPSTGQLKDIFRELVRDCGCAYIILDAIDECSEANEQRNAVLRFIEELYHSMRPKLKFLVLSRDEADIRQILIAEAEAKEFPLETLQLKDDIRCYVANQINRHQRLNSSLSIEMKEHVVNTVTNRADGMFRWAYCQVERLKKLRLARAKDIENVLDSLPDTLYGTYERILCEISEIERDAAVSALQWLAFSKRPLTSRELKTAIAFENHPLDGLPTQDDLMSLEGLIELTSGLVIWEGRHSDHLRLAHFSVREYLVSTGIRNGRCAAFALQEDDCECHLARQCLSYLFRCCSDFASSHGSLPIDDERYRFLRYAAPEWHRHQKSVKIRSDGQADMMFLEALLDKDRYQEMMQLYRPENPDFHLRRGRKSLGIYQIASPLYYVSYLGLSFCVEKLLLEGCDVNVQGGFHQTPLRAAVSAAEASVVDRLLNAGADVNIQGGELGNALGTAAAQGHSPLIMELLHRQADISASQGIALYLAIRYGRLDIVKILLNCNIDAEITNDQYGTPLIAAARWGQAPIAGLLLEHGAKANTPQSVANSKIMDPLQAAAGCKITQPAIETIKLLLDHGAELNTVRGELGTALVSACEGVNEQTAIALLELGADPNLHSESGVSPLEIAISNGMLHLTVALQDYGARLKGFDQEIEKCGGQRNYVAGLVKQGTYYGKVLDHEDWDFGRGTVSTVTL